MGLWLREVEGKDRFIPFIKSLFLIFGFINVFRAIRAIGFQLLGSEDQMEFMGRSAFREAAFAVPCAILLCYFLGVTGLPLGNLFVLIASTIVFLMPKYSNLLGESYSRFALNTLARPALYGMVSFISVGILVRQVGPIDSWFLLLSRAFLPTLIIFLLLLPMTLTSSELKVILLRLGALIGFRQVR